MSATTKKMFNINKLCKNVQKATSTKILTSQTNTTKNRDKTQTKEEAPWFLSKAGSPKGKMQPQEEGFGETRRKHLCQSGSANKGRGFGETRRKHLCRSRSVHRNPWRMFGTSHVFSGHNKRKGFIEKPNLRKRRSARKTLEQFHSRR